MVRARHDAVTRKVSRTRRVNGAELAGTEYDPRKDRSTIAKLNRRQLETTLRSYNTFTNRKTQFYGDAERRPIKRSAWLAYKAAETKLNQASAARFGEFANTDVPGRGMTAKQYRAATKSEFPRAADPAVNDPYAQFNRQPNNIASAKQLDKLVKDLNKRSTPAAHARLLNKGKSNATDMLDVIGDDTMKRAVRKLNKRQFEWLWNISPFAKSASLRYSVASAMSADRQASWMDDVMDEQTSDMWDMVRAAQGIK